MKKAVIMAGGFGTRLRPLTCNVPKPMVSVANSPMMEHIVNLLRRHNITDIVSLLYFQPEHIMNHFGDGKNFGITMNYVLAQADYGTAGAVRNAYEHLRERFIIISGDVLTDLDISGALEFHEKNKAKATIILTRASNPLQFGIVMTNSEGKITRFLEKPSWGEVFSDTINTGIYILEPEVLDLIPYQSEFDFSKDLFPLMLKNEMPLYGYISNSYWADIGNLNQYQEAAIDILNGNVQVEIRGTKSENAHISESAVVHQSAKLNGFVVIGNNSTIGQNVEITNSMIGNNVRIKPGAIIKNSVIWNDVVVGEFAELTDDVICNNVTIGDSVNIAENVFIADDCVIGDYAKLLSNIKLWPNKVVESHSTLSRSLVQEEKWLRELFYEARVSGLSNIEMNPEFGAKFGSALGNAFGANNTVVVSRDPNQISRMMKRSIVAGLMSTGVDVIDLQVTPLPLTRHELLSGKAVAGFHVRQNPRNPNLIDIIVLNADGRDLPTSKAKSIERLFFGEDIKRVAPDDVGYITFPERSAETYIARYLSALDVKKIQSRRYNIVVDYSYGMISSAFPRILGEMNVNAIALNGYADSNRSVRSDGQLEQAREQVSNVLSSLKYDLGFMIDPGAEKIFVIDEEGNWYTQYRMLSIIAKLFVLVNKDREPYKIALPITASSEIEEVIKGHNVEVVWIKNSHSAMMEATRDKNVLFVGGTRGGHIFSDYFFAADAMYTIGKLLEMLAISGKRICDISREIPERHVLSKMVPCPWEKKGTIMRRAMEYSEGMERMLVDGVKIFDQENSVLFIPDKEKAQFQVLVETNSSEKSQEILERYVNLVQEWRDA